MTKGAANAPATARAETIRAARELLEIYERNPEMWGRVMSGLTPQDIETLREIAAWDQDEGDE